MVKTVLKWTAIVVITVASFVAGMLVGGYEVEQWYQTKFTSERRGGSMQ